MALLSTIQGPFQVFAAELRLLLSFLRERQLLWLALATALLLALAVQPAPGYRLDIGQEDGPGADLPLISGFNTPEQDAHGSFRWTTAESSINLTGFGSRPLSLKLHFFPVNEEIATRGPHSFELWYGAQQLGVLPVRPKGGSYQVLLPPSPQGQAIIGLRSATIVPGGDQRELGLVLNQLELSGWVGALPDWRAILGWLAALLLAWLIVRRLGYAVQLASLMLTPPVMLLGLAASLDPPRLNLGPTPALITLSMSLGFVLALCAESATPGMLALAVGGAGLICGEEAANLLYPAGLLLLLAAILRRPVARLWALLEQGDSPERRRVVALVMILTFALHYAGKIYPFSMPGDIGFHVNRFGEAIAGRIFILSKNRGVDFPYPPALYVLLAPLTLLSSRRDLLHLSAALMDAISPVLVYLIARRSGLIASWRAAVAAGALYGLSGALLMTTWWNFSTHIFAQFAHLALVAALVLSQALARDQETQDPRPETQEEIRRSREEHTSRPDKENGQRVATQYLVSVPLVSVPSVSAPRTHLVGVMLIFLQLVLYLAHFGFWMNMSLISAMGLGLLVVPVLWKRERKGQLSFFFSVVVIAQLITVLLFYSAYTGLFVDQLSSTASGGFTGLAGRGAVPKDVLWSGLLEGLYAHLGMLPILLAPLALLLPGRSTQEDLPQSHSATKKTAHSFLNLRSLDVVRVLMLTSFVVGLAFAVLPFLTGSTLSTRWLMFCLWAICVACAALGERLWTRGRAGRLVVMSSAAFIIWNSAVIWLSALAWRVRPPEPF